MENIFDKWPTAAALASDLGQKYQTVAAWKHRGSIPAKYDLLLVEAAGKRGESLTLEDLAIARQRAGT